MAVQNLTISLMPNERVDDLQCDGLKIIQNKDMFCFGMDAVLLANFVKLKNHAKYMDLGTGTGVIPLLLAGKCNGASFEDVSLTALEVQEPCAAMAARSVELNGLSEKVSILHGDIKEVFENFKKASFDIVTCNPPYISGGKGLDNPSAPKNIARHEILVTLKDVVAAAAHLLKDGGSFYMVHKPFRLPEIFAEMRDHGLEPKTMRLVQPFKDKEPNMVLVEAVKGGGAFLKILPTLNVYDTPGVYTKEILTIYGETGV